MFGSCVAVVAMAVLYEGLKAVRQRLKDAAIEHSRNSRIESGTNTPLNDDEIILRNPAFLTWSACSQCVLFHTLSILTIRSSI